VSCRGRREPRRHGEETGGSCLVFLRAGPDEARWTPAPLYRFKTDDEAIKMANDTEFGSSHFYSRDIGRICCIAESLGYGIDVINKGVISARRWARAHAFSLACGSFARDHRAQSRHLGFRGTR